MKAKMVMAATITSVALFISSAGVATAVDLDTVSGGKSELSVVDFGVVSDAEGVVSDAEVEQLAQELENIFTTYLSQNNAGHWFVTAAGYGSNIKQSDLEVIAARLNSKISVNNAGM
ncbi:hypothetical protein JTE88_02525 [Arcanobacterium phocisimile]|uniref:Uncharacterized protein n=1 Tax=Arcanobacterium phocisimile TaxID=1302235 RepID=A0ABX7III2_9ACTO|nr:hypothetical protein [Arcanobacterium phocisimile]QRV02637.1 hypothetical protein JTE88_02525 [Arcanobacterium phocisimile]